MIANVIRSTAGVVDVINDPTFDYDDTNRHHRSQQVGVFDAIMGPHGRPPSCAIRRRHERTAAPARACGESQCPGDLCPCVRSRLATTLFVTKEAT